MWKNESVVAWCVLRINGWFGAPELKTLDMFAELAMMGQKQWKSLKIWRLGVTNNGNRRELGARAKNTSIVEDLALGVQNSEVLEVLAAGARMPRVLLFTSFEPLKDVALCLAEGGPRWTCHLGGVPSGSDLMPKIGAMVKRDYAKFASQAESTSAPTSADVLVREGEGEPRCRLGRCTHKDPEVGEGTWGHGRGTVGPAVEALKSEWDQAKQAAKKPPMSVQITATQEFVTAHLDPNRQNALHACWEEGTHSMMEIPQDHNMWHEGLDLITEHSTGLYIELGRVATNCHFAVDCDRASEVSQNFGMKSRGAEL